MRMYNAVAHPIHFVEGATHVPEIRAFVGGNVVMTFPKDEIMLSVRKESKYLHSSFGFPAYEKVFVGAPDSPDIIPDHYDGIVVSAWYAQEAQRLGYDLSRLWLVCDPVFEDETKTRQIGVRGLSKY